MEKNNNNQQAHQFFNLNDKIQEIIKSNEMKHSLARTGAKEGWLKFLQSGDASGFIEEDRLMVDRALDLINTYALLVAYEQFHMDKEVNHFMETLEKMSQGHDLHEQMGHAVAKLPETFKDAVHKASLRAQEAFFNAIKGL